ncbi:transposase [Brachybacterium sp. EF45031]|nr:transposase [Brachybacterium sillae]
MPRKNYTDEFRREAVELYEHTPGATLRGVAADLGVSCGTLATWRREQGYTGPRTEASDPHSDAPEGESPQARIARLEAQVRRLEDEKRMLATERDILRKAAKYFAGETNW